MNYRPERALELLRLGTNLPKAEFRADQEDAVRRVVEGQRRLLIVQRTGWGKSFVYFIATKLLREQGAGPTLLVSPLIALMRNQVEAAERMGVRAATINSSNKGEWEGIEERIRGGNLDIILISPERFANERFQTQVLDAVGSRVGLLVIDEAHCISDWGHDFRPHYRRLERLVRSLPANLRLLATTATANQRVMDDLREILGPDLAVSRGELARPSLALQTLRLPSQAERLAWLAQYLPEMKGTGIVYALTVRDAERVTDWLRSKGLEVKTYTGSTANDQRAELEQELLGNRVKALIATTALGMGFDKPDLAFVVHYQSPGSVVAYYQQVGRAGRSLRGAYGVLLSGREEADITDFFIEAAFPSREEVGKVLAALEAAPNGLSLPELLPLINATRGRIEKTLELLSLESPAPIAPEGARWQLVGATLRDEFWERTERLTKLRRDEQRQMQDYVQLTDGHMDFLLRALDGKPGGRASHGLTPLPASVDPELLREATAFLRRSSLPFFPRKKFPKGKLPFLGVEGSIYVGLQAQPGKTLCVWGDAGWGELVRRGKYEVGRFDDALVQASAELLREWSPKPAPTWVTCIPSLRHPELVPDFAARLAAALGLPFRPVLKPRSSRPEQKKMANSAQQARNVDGSLCIDGKMPPGPVLLVDDMVDSRWTLTVAAYLLRKHGSGEVWPYALALTSLSE